MPGVAVGAIPVAAIEAIPLELGWAQERNCGRKMKYLCGRTRRHRWTADPTGPATLSRRSIGEQRGREAYGGPASGALLCLTGPTQKEPLGKGSARKRYKSGGIYTRILLF